MVPHCRVTGDPCSVDDVDQPRLPYAATFFTRKIDISFLTLPNPLSRGFLIEGTLNTMRPTAPSPWP